MTTIKIRGALTVGGAIIRCPGRGAGNVPRELTLMTSGSAVNATCGEKHRGEDGGKRAQCWFRVEQLTAANLNTLAQGKPGNFRMVIKDGAKVEGKLAAIGGTANASTAARAAAASNKGDKAPAGPARPAGRATGGAMTAAFGALAAVATATGQVASASASAVGSMADLGREGVGAARDGIKEAGAYGERRHERKMRLDDES